MATVTKPIALDESLNTTEQTPRNVADVLAQELARIAGRQASDVDYDNTDSGLTADNVQDAIDELKSDIPTVNDGTLTIQQNGEAKGTFTANQSGNSTVNIETPTTDIQTAVDEFSTYNGGLLSECKVALSPNQDLHGYSEPWVGGAGKNKLPMTVDGIKAANTSGTWSGNRYTHVSGMTVGILTDTDNNVVGLDFDGTTSTNAINFVIASNISIVNGTYILNTPSASNKSGMWLSTSNPTMAIILENNTSGNVTVTDGTIGTVYAYFNQGTTLSHFIIRPMIRLASESDPTFEPYSNICPISGHTQVEVDVSDGQTTQEQVTVNLGGTYYSGTLDVVTGMLTVDSAFIASYNGETLPSMWISDRDVYAVGTTPTTGAEVCYKLATPQTIQLTPQQVKALVGENHLSAPLDGQEITESEYRELFTWDEVEAYVNAHSGGGGGVDYSTTEVDIGIKWTDGKPIYMRTFTNVGLPQNSYSATLDLGVEADTIVKIEANDSANAGNATIIFEGVYAKINKTAGSNTILNPTNQLAHLSGATLTVYYTKATD